MFKKFFLFGVMALALSTPAQVAKQYFGLGGTAISTTNSHAIISGYGAGIARVQYINGTSDATAGAFRFRLPSAVVEITALTNASQAIIVAVGTAFAAGDICVLQHVAADTYQRLVVSAVTATNITFTANLAAAVVAGDRVYQMATAATIPVGVATKELNGGSGAFFNGVEGKPILIDLDGGTNVTVNAVSGSYARTNF